MVRTVTFQYLLSIPFSILKTFKQLCACELLRAKFSARILAYFPSLQKRSFTLQNRIDRDTNCLPGLVHWPSVPAGTRQTLAGNRAAKDNRLSILNSVNAIVGVQFVVWRLALVRHRHRVRTFAIVRRLSSFGCGSLLDCSSL